MEIIIRKTIEEKIQINLPEYVQFSGQYTKFLDKDWCLVIDDWGTSSGIGISWKPKSQHNPFGNDGWKFITEAEFNEVYNKVSEQLSKYKP